MRGFKLDGYGLWEFRSSDIDAVVKQCTMSLSPQEVSNAVVIVALAILLRQISLQYLSETLAGLTSVRGPFVLWCALLLQNL